MKYTFGIAVLVSAIAWVQIFVVMTQSQQGQVKENFDNKIAPSSFSQPEPLPEQVNLAQVQDVFTPDLVQTSNQPYAEVTQNRDQKAFQAVMENAIAQNWSSLPMSEIMQKVSEQFLGAKYQAGLLDEAESETFFASLTQFDCVLFIETVLAIARGIVQASYDYDTFAHHLIDQRYWNGHMNGYCSRLHYFSEWIIDNQKRGNVRSIASFLGGIPLSKKLNFMSSHRYRYPRMVNNEANYQCIVEMEANLDTTRLNYIPHGQINGIYPQLQPGDLIGVVTRISGLDVTHTGMVYRTPEGNMGFIHASPAGQVAIAPDLHTYIGHVPNATGILVARPVDPR